MRSNIIQVKIISSNLKCACNMSLMLLFNPRLINVVQIVYFQLGEGFGFRGADLGVEKISRVCFNFNFVFTSQHGEMRVPVCHDKQRGVRTC